MKNNKCRTIKILKRFIGAFLSAVMVISLLPVYAATGEPPLEAPPNTAVARLGETLETVGIAEVKFGTTNKPNVVTRDGHKAWQINYQEANERALYIKLDEEFKPSEFDGTEYVIEVDYFDTSIACFRVVYDDRVYHKSFTDFTYSNTADMWKTATYTLEDAAFQNSLEDGYDIEITTYTTASTARVSWESVPIKEIRITKKPQKNILYASANSKLWGHSYAHYSEEKLIYNTIENLSSEAVDFDIKYEIVSDEGVLYFEKTDTMTLTAGETKETIVDFGELTHCSNYDYYVTTTNKQTGDTNRRKVMILSVIKTDPDGIKNEDFYFNSHMERMMARRTAVADVDAAAERLNGGLDVMSLANVGGIRNDLLWETLDVSGSFKLNSSYRFDLYFQYMKEHGLKYIPIMDAGHSSYTGGYKILANDPQSLARCLEYVSYVATELGDVIDIYELFNEPNLTSFNANVNDYADGAFVARLSDQMAEAIYKNDKDATVYGLSVCSLMMDASKEFFKSAVSSGVVANTMEGFSYHPYVGSPVDDCTPYEYFMKFYKDILDTEVKPGFKLLNTEFGYTTPDSDVKNDERKGPMTLQSYIYYKIRNLADVQCVYVFEHKGEHRFKDREDNFGYVSGYHDSERRYGTWFLPDRSYLQIAALNYAMADSEPVELLDNDERKIRLSHFKSNKFGKDLLTLYTNGEPQQISIRLGTDKVRYIDTLGNEEEIYGTDGVFTFKAGFEPEYIIGSFKEIELLDENPAFSIEAANKVVAVNDICKLTADDHTARAASAEVANLPMGNEVLKCEKASNGRFEIEISNNLDMGSVYRPEIILRDKDGKTLCKYAVRMESTCPVEVDVSFEMADRTDLYHWKADVKIKNLSETTPAKGTFKFLGPEDIASSSVQDIGVITTSRTGAFSIDLPMLKKKGRQLASYEVELDDGRVYTFSQKYDTTLAAYAERKPVIDGKIDEGEWVMSTAMYADSIEQVYWNVEVRDSFKMWDSANEVSGRSVIEWDEENLYLMAEVTDDVFYQAEPGATSWKGDNMQFGISYEDDGIVAIGQGGTTFHEFGIALSPDGPSCYRTLSQDNTYEKGYCENANIAIKRNGNKTVYELCMPWKDILKSGQEVFEGAEMLYSFLFNDNDGSGRQGWIECGSGVGMSKDISLFMKLTLIK